MPPANSPIRNVFATLKRWWMAFAAALGWVNTRVILTVVYFTLFAVGALVLRLLGKDLLSRKYHTGSTYWIKKERTDDSLERAKHQF
ncbi:MAG TPA: SxtJ family membrane protein [Bacteroidota bacterium]|jgi:hypothetical protein